MKNMNYTLEVSSIDYGYLLVEYDYFDEDASVGLGETYDWFAYTTEAFENEPAGTDVTYELSPKDQIYILIQMRKHYRAMMEDFSA